ncbi:pollen-specific leucine-rich repeat extensin-like protein 4 [Iris pallida]|uniref:Pollen-specific leucine-rich repeat extensin-like protein 4 n=1 Tax=Iris pallida TaxID=29817 RepID=A0AAX6FLF0_IRIPA|nr:pollen-specific leucine-rich repeat extensin-like protein 4 [Iris pallida]
MAVMKMMMVVASYGHGGAAPAVLHGDGRTAVDACAAERVRGRADRDRLAHLLVWSSGQATTTDGGAVSTGKWWCLGCSVGGKSESRGLMILLCVSDTPT